MNLINEAFWLQNNMEIWGHEEIKDFLVKADEQDKLAHAYLFSGPRHVGKKTLTTWFIKRLFCAGDSQSGLFEAGNSDRPCESCVQCNHINQNQHPDLFFLEPLDKKHQISIEQIRKLQSSLSHTPALASRTIAVIEAAEQLSLAAHNALLKTLEEPTKTSMLFLITSMPDQLPVTIRSRCQPLEFSFVYKKPASAEETLWKISAGLPGVYKTIEEETTKQYQTEKDLFSDLISSTPAARLTYLEKLFSKKKKDHSDEKKVWMYRIDLWKKFLRDLAMLQLNLPERTLFFSANDSQSITVTQAMEAIDSLDKIQNTWRRTPIQIRMHLEYFFVSIV